MIECSFIAILSVIIINFTKKIYFHIFFDLSIKYSSFQILIFFLICYSLTTRVDTFNAFVSRLSQFSSVIQLCLSLCDSMDCSTPGFPVLHYLPELFKVMSIESVMPSNHLILCHPLLLLPSVFPSIRVFSNESTFPTR